VTDVENIDIVDIIENIETKKRAPAA